MAMKIPLFLVYSRHFRKQGCDLINQITKFRKKERTEMHGCQATEHWLIELSTLSW